MSFFEFQDPNEASSKDELYSDILLPLAVDAVYTYKIPTELHSKAKFGLRAAVQFGKKNVYTGLIVSVHKNKPEGYLPKLIIDILDIDPQIDENSFLFWKWISSYYLSDVGSVMDLALPSTLKLKSESLVVLKDNYILGEYELSDKENEVLKILFSQQTVSISKLSELITFKGIHSVLKSLYDKQFLYIIETLEEKYKSKKEYFVFSNFDIENKEMLASNFEKLKNSPKQQDLLLAFVELFRRNKGAVKKTELIKLAGAGIYTVKSIYEKQILYEEEFEMDRIVPFKKKIIELDHSEATKQKTLEIQQGFKEKDVCLFQFPNGKQKINILLSLISTLKKGEQVLLLVPEIFLSSELVQILGGYLGSELAIYHSKFSPNERFEIWNKVKRGEIKVLIGVRSALFIPFKNLKLCIVDEENDSNYKQFEGSSRIQYRDASIYLMNLLKGKTLLVSEFPSFESLFNAKSGRFSWIKDTQINPMGFQFVYADMQQQRKSNTLSSMFSQPLINEIQENFNKSNRTLLFQNVRGYAPIIECLQCGWSPGCSQCDISVTYFESTKEMSCHYCGERQVIPRKCRDCGSSNLKMVGFGTEKVEEEVLRLFPEIPVIRIDKDTTKNKNFQGKLFQEIEKGLPAILVGTQMITKGMPIQNLHFTAILSMDMMLRVPDFRASEKSYQNIFKLASRFDSKRMNNQFMIQTYKYENQFFEFLNSGNYEAFYSHYVLERKTFHYPPFFRLIKIIIKGIDEKLTKDAAIQLGKQLSQIQPFEILGPESPSVSRIRGEYIFQIMLKFSREDLKINAKKRRLKEIIQQLKADKLYKKIRIQIDVDPY